MADHQIITILLEFNYRVWIKIKMKKEKGKEERENCVEHIQSDRELWNGICILGTTILHHDEHNSCWSMCHSYTNTYTYSYQNSVKAFMITQSFVYIALC